MTTLVYADPSEADKPMEIIASCQAKEMIIHARVREDYYAGAPRTEDFKRAVSVYRKAGGTADICYNGNIASVKDYKDMLDILGTAGEDKLEGSASNCSISSVMLGRGLLSDPSLARQIRGGAALTPEELRAYLRNLYESYAEFIPEDRNVIFKMLEHWAYLHVHFRDCDRYLKAIRKSRSKAEYHAAVNNIFAKCEFL